jgi:molecular chaperone HscC
LIVGDTAREVSQAQPAMAAALFKRAMGTERRYKLGREEFGAPELSAMVLRALKADAEAHLGAEVCNVVFLSQPISISCSARPCGPQGGLPA